MKRQDIYLILGLLVVTGILFLGFQFLNRGAGEDAVIYVGDEEIARFSLQEDTTYVIQGMGNGRNYLEIRDGQANMLAASCPDQICVHQRPVSEIGEAIVCMPNQVIVAVESQKR